MRVLMTSLVTVVLFSSFAESATPEASDCGKAIEALIQATMRSGRTAEAMDMTVSLQVLNTNKYATAQSLSEKFTNAVQDVTAARAHALRVCN